MFDRIAVPTPFAVGRVNTYVAGRTVVDPGPNSDQSWNELVDGLADLGLEPDDIEQVLITHPHLDHFGMGKRFADRGARLLASPETADIVEDFPARLAHEQSFFEPFFVRCGVEPAVAETIVTLPDPFLSYASSFDVDVELTAGDTVDIDGESVTVDTVAGHAVGELTFEFDDAGEDHVVVGDIVLPETTPNPFLQPPPKDGGERPRQVLRFNRTLEELAERDYDRMLPGHGEMIDRPTERVSEIREAHEERTEKVRTLVDGPTQPVEVKDGLFGDLPVVETFPAMAEAIGHLELLEERGVVERVPDTDDVVYRPVE